MEIQSIGNIWLWSGFIAFVLFMLAIDLGIFHRKSHKVSFKEAAVWSLVWVSLAMIFNLIVWFQFGEVRATEFLTGYIIEKSLSVDNIFIFVIIFSALGIPSLYQHKVLFWGIISALIMRAGMIFAGTALMAKFHWLIYIFGGLLILTGIKLFIQRNKEQHPENTWSMRLAKKIIPSTHKFDGDKFFIIENGKRLATPLFMALILIEITDLIFAVDSIPAIFAITNDPYIVFTSNIFAILGLRSLYFLMEGLVERFIYLKVGLASVLIFVGLKMSLVDFYKVSPVTSLAVIALLLGTSIGASLWATRNKEAKISNTI